MFYKPLTKDNIFSIIDLLINSLRERLKERQLDLRLTDAAKNYIVEQGYDPTYGARPLKRFLQSKVETLIARMIIAQDLRPQSVLVVDYDGEKLHVDVQ